MSSQIFTHQYQILTNQGLDKTSFGIIFKPLLPNLNMSTQIFTHQFQILTNQGLDKKYLWIEADDD